MIREEAWPFYRTSSGVRLWWESKEPKGPKQDEMIQRTVLTPWVFEYPVPSSLESAFLGCEHFDAPRLFHHHTAHLPPDPSTPPLTGERFIGVTHGVGPYVEA